MGVDGNADVLHIRSMDNNVKKMGGSVELLSRFRGGSPLGECQAGRDAHPMTRELIMPRECRDTLLRYNLP